MVNSIGSAYASSDSQWKRQSAVKGTYNQLISAAGLKTQSYSGLGSIDTDGDGTVSADEYNALISKKGLENAPTAEDFFKRYDKNSDGKISSDEIIAAHRSGRPSMGHQHLKNDTKVTFSADYDTDSDGSLSKEEYQAAMSGVSGVLSADDFFAQVDTNADGKISSDEFDTAYKTNRHQRESAANNDKVIPSDIDADGDGTVSADEYEDLVAKMGINDALSAEDFFKEYDKNSDGEISADEIIAGLNTASQETTAAADQATEASAAPNTSENEASEQEAQAQILSVQYQKQIEKMLDAYELNYDYMFGTQNKDAGITA